MRGNYVKVSQHDILLMDAKLRLDELVISHIGDGEYFCNIFGNVFSSYLNALVISRKKNPNMEIVKEVGLDSYYLGYPINLGHYYIESELIPAKLDDTFNTGQ